MDLLQLKYFRELAYCQHMTEVSEKLHISQPALSITISKLEEELGVKLFDRVGRKIILNEYGKIFLSHIDKIFNELECAMEEINKYKGIKNKKIILATTGTTFLADFIITFLERYPDLNIKQFIIDNSEAIRLLEKGEIDFAITYPPIKLAHIESKVLIEDEILVAVPLNHNLSKRDFISLKDLENENFINLVEHYGFRKIVDKIYHEANFNPNIILEGEISLVEKALNAGLGIVIVSRKFVEQYPDFPAKTLKLIEPYFKWEIAISWLKERHMNEVLKQFKDYALRYYKK